jgi:hypothetical protein
MIFPPQAGNKKRAATSNKSDEFLGKTREPAVGTVFMGDIV